MEKIADQEDVIDVFESDIALYLRMFCEANEIDNIKSESQSVWNGALRYIRKHVFNNRDVLKSKDNINIYNNNIPSNFNAYNYDTVNSVCDIYIDLCFVYDKEVSIIGFSNLTGIDQELIYNWGNEGTKLSSTSYQIYKKLNEFREESLSNKLVTGRQNPVGVLGVLNRHYAWNLPGVSREQTEKRALTARDLPKLGTNQPEELPQTGQNCIEIGDNSADHDT